MADLTNEPVRKPVWILYYETKDISVAIHPFVLQVTYTNHLSGTSDELEITLEDRGHKWKAAWMPTRGDFISLKIGYEGEKLRPCGDFQVDEIEYNGPPDTVSIRALAAIVKPALRTTNSAGYESMTLRKIACEIADKHGLTIVGSVPEIKVERVSQHRETDLGFLKRLGESYGYVFTVRGTQLVWHELAKLDAADAVATITRKNLAGSYTLRAKTSQIYKACQVKYFDPKKKKDITHTFKAQGVTTGDLLKLDVRCENKQQAEAKATAALRNTNGNQIEGNITICGDQRFGAGQNVMLSGWGALDGKYQVIKSRHTMERGSGYKTELELSTTSAHVVMKNLKNLKRVVKVDR